MNANIPTGKLWVILFLAMILVSCGQDLHAQSSLLKVDYLTTAEGLSENRVQYLLNDKNGFLIIIGGEKFNQWDGSTITQFGIPDSYYFFTFDNAGNIIASTHKGLYVITDPLQNKFHSVLVPFANGRCPFATDGKRWIWIGTPSGYVSEYVYDTDTIRYIRELNTSPENAGTGAVYAVYLQDSTTLWLGCENGLFTCRLMESHILTPCLPESEDGSIMQDPVYSFFQDTNGMLWLGTAKGLRLIDPKAVLRKGAGFKLNDLSLKYPVLKQLSDETIYAIQSDQHDELFFRSGKAIYAFQKSRDTIELLHHEDIDRYDEHYAHAEYSLCYMEGGILWYGTDQGVGKLNLNQRAYTVYRHDPEDHYSLCDNSLNQVVIDREGILWVGTTGKGLNRGIPDPDGRGYRFERFVHDPRDPYSLHSNTVSHLFADSKGRVWVGAGSIQQVIRQNGRTRFVYPEFVKQFPENNTPERVISIREDTLGNIWLGCIGSNFIFNPETGYWSWFYLTEDRPWLEFQNLFVTSDGQHYSIAYYSGVYKIHFPLRQLDSVTVCPSSVDMIIDRFLFRDLQDVTSNIFETGGNKEIWTATFQHFRLDDSDKIKKAELIHVYTPEEGIPWEHSYAMLQDNSGRMWMGTENGLCCIDPSTDLVRTLWKEDGPSTNSYYYGPFKDESGKFYFPSRDGLIIFRPEKVSFYPAPKVILNSISIDPKVRRRSSQTTREPRVIESPGRSIELSYNHNSIFIDYIAVDYVAPDRVKYLWMLRDKKGRIEIQGSDKKAVFVDLRPGKYQFSVKAANHNNVWSTGETGLDIRILPPPWLTWYAYALYTLLVLSIVLLYRRFLLHRARLRTALEVERVEKEKIVELDQMKSRFFANISHEFRTPLTLIAGPVEDLVKSNQQTPQITRDTLNIIRRNLERLKRLINQLLDVARVESGSMKLQVAPGDLTTFCRTLCQSFLSLAESRHVDYICDLEEYSGSLYFDADKLEKVLSNLISNSFKFTPEGGLIRVNLAYIREKGGGEPVEALLSVSDNGKGIAKNQLDKIFDRFYQVESSDKRSAEGTGIGLSLTRELIELYHGDIQVESTPGQGSRFIVRIPVARNTFREEEIGPSGEPLQKQGEELTSKELPESVGSEPVIYEEQDGKPLVLVVEDNSDLRKYISQQLADTCRLEAAENGKKGMALAVKNIPDLVITDLMMPVMDGMELCRSLKTDEKTSHIPIIMLTARADRESKLKGLNTGADDYLIKPFDSEELKVRVGNLIRQRQVLREKFRKEFFSVSPDAENKPYNDQLLNRMTTLFEQHIDDPDFDIEQLSTTLNMSRTQLFRKIQAITGHAPKELLRNMRLRTAARLFLSGHDQVTQVMFRVGFNNSSWFTKSFRELYGLTPTEFIKKHTGTARH